MGSMLAMALGACTAEPADDGATSGASTPAGFETWLAEQCPDGASLQVGEPGRVVACEHVRERAVADPAVRDRLVEVYMGRAAEADVGEAREPLTPLGGPHQVPPGEDVHHEGIVALVTEREGVTRYLAGIGELTDVPERAPSRGPPYWKSTVLRRKALGDAA